MTFFLGTHEPSWLSRTNVPLFVSRRRLARLKQLPVARGVWALDSGGFTELQKYGTWRTEPKRYAEEVSLWRDQIGGMQWAAVQDWMCEPHMLEKTGRSVAEHQALTIQSYFDLKSLAPQIPWTPVLQGWRIDDYVDHVQQYAAAGVDLSRLPIVGVGSVCRRQATAEATEIFGELARIGIRCHGFGLKVQGLRNSARSLASADSMAWSFRARRSPPLPGCRHKSCANCLRFALRWRENVVRVIRGPVQCCFGW
ncbi:deazapurine DNA modification protein DpdA family protein [Singulisphaera rosea]